MKNTPASEKFFWDRRAENYPRPFEAATRAKTRRIIRLLGRMGAGFTGRDILDIGCGTGIYALALAARAGTVLGIDSSPAMLKIFRAESRARGLKNARCLLAAWAGVAPAGIRGRFDVALASMTMAIKGKADLLKMEAAARERCVYIGWAGIRRNSLLEKVYALHGLEYKAPEGAGRVLRLLKSLGRTPTVRYISDSWEKKTSATEAMREIEVSMKANGAALRRDRVENLLARRTRGGKIRQVTRVRKALITWRPPPKRLRTTPRPGF